MGLAYRVQLKLADVAEEFANLCYADGFGCTQVIDSKKVEITCQPWCEMAAHSYLDRRKEGTNLFIERFLDTYA